MKFYEWGKAYCGGTTTLLHGKLLQFETDKGMFLLIGSANATCGAFGLISGYFNDEVSILIHSKNHIDYLAELGLNFDVPITFEEAKSLSEPLHTSNPNKQNYKVYIEAAEVLGNRLSIKLSHDCKECAIVLE